MEKIQLNDLKLKELISATNKSVVYLLDNGQVLKVYNPHMLAELRKLGIDEKQKIADAKILPTIPEILIPLSMVYDRGVFVGYTMPKAKGIDYNTYDYRDKCDLKEYIKMHLKLESIVKRGNKEGIIFPDLCTCDNIFVHNDEFSLIDYDGLQIGNHRTNNYSTSLGDPVSFFNTKHITPEGLFTEEIDKRGLIILFFLTALNVNLNRVDIIDPFTGHRITLDEVFNYIGLEDYDIMNKVWKVFQNDQQNEFLGEDLYHLLDCYKLEILASLGDNQYIKRLVRK